jgi:hypothetical protein
VYGPEMWKDAKEHQALPEASKRQEVVLPEAGDTGPPRTVRNSISVV